MKKAAISSSITIAYKTIGNFESELPLLIFLHEGMGSIELFRDFPESLCSEMKLPGVVYDRYGYGYSTGLMEDRKDDYLEKEAQYYLPLLLNTLKIQNRKLILIGHSDGASIALIYASLFPENIEFLVSIAAHVFTEEISIENAKLLEERYFKDEEFRKKISRYHFDHTESTLLAFTRTITRASFKKWNIESYLKNISAPILVIQGEKDEYGTEKQVDSIVNHSSNSKTKKLLIANCGHSPHLQMKDLTLKEIVRFYKSVS